MRITFQLDDELLAEIKLYAARSGKTMTVVIEDSLRAVLAHQREVDCEHKQVSLTTVPGNGLQPGGNLDDSAALLTLMDDADDLA
jgi:hypothetical protein